jgi:hypothetical protein
MEAEVEHFREVTTVAEVLGFTVREVLVQEAIVEAVEAPVIRLPEAVALPELTADLEEVEEPDILQEEVEVDTMEVEVEVGVQVREEEEEDLHFWLPVSPMSQVPTGATVATDTSA